MVQLTPHTGLVETLGLTPKKSIHVTNLLLLQYLYGWFMWSKYMWLDMRDAFRDFAKIKKTVSTNPGLPYRAHLLHDVVDNGLMYQNTTTRLSN